MESRFAVTFFRAVAGNLGVPSFVEVDPVADGQAKAMMSKAEIIAKWDEVKYRFPQQIVVIAEGRIIACSTYAVTVPRELVWLYDSAQDRLDAKIAHFKK